LIYCKNDKKQLPCRKIAVKDFIILLSMFFILSKTLNFFLSPFNWMLLLFLWWLIAKNQQRKRKLGITLLIMLLVFSNPYLIHKITLAWQAPRKEFTPNEKYNTGILLAGFVGFEYKKSQGYYGGASDRFIQAIRLYKLGHIKKIIITGGSGNPWRQEYKEADFVKEQLIEMGIPPNDIISENQSRNTFENAVNTKRVLDSLKMKEVSLLITSSMHMKRSQKAFYKAGIKTVAYPCNFNAIANPQGFFASVVPSYKALDGWDIFLKESVGLLVYKLTGKA
jgi:uncharacterized SAM-binding protein YcdF (DUF218 family)